MFDLQNSANVRVFRLELCLGPSYTLGTGHQATSRIGTSSAS